MRIISKNFIDAVLTKLVETCISIKVWILVVIFYFVDRLFLVADELRIFMMTAISEAPKMQVLASLQSKIYDITTSLIITGIVVIVLSRVTFQHAKLKNGYHSPQVENESMDSIKNEFA